MPSDFMCHHYSCIFEHVISFNPRPDGVWQVTGPDGVVAQRAPLLISGTNSWIGKIQTASKDLIELPQNEYR